MSLRVQLRRRPTHYWKRGVFKGLSVGYDSVKDRMVDVVRRLSEIKLWETSLVTFSLESRAQVTGVKTAEDLGAGLPSSEPCSPSAAKASGGGSSLVPRKWQYWV